jgi:hypothetical protein
MVADPVQVPLVLPAWLEPLERQVERTVDRLRGRSLTRLWRPLVPGSGSSVSAAEATRALAQQLADDAAAFRGEPRRVLPTTDLHVLPDLLAVVGHDLLIALAAVDDPDGPARGSSGSAVAVTPRGCAADASTALMDLRHAL